MNREKKTYIEGIYNYCNRWCEKCGFTSNCYLFTTESRITSHQILNNGEMPKAEDIFPKLDDIDEDDDDLFYDEDEDFAQSDGLPDFGGEESIPDEEIEKEMEEERKFFEQNNSPLEELTADYMEKSHPLIKKLDEKYNFYQTPKETIEDPGLKKLHDNFEIFSYYHAFIHVKFKRAMHGKLDILKEDDEEMKEFHTYDMNGTAKIALISVNNSIEALNELYNSLPEFNNEITELLVLSGKIKNEAEKEFPDCYSFKRPGFDE